MAAKKKDLEIIYNVEWKNKPSNGGDKSNIIGMYDIPATTLNWETFKSYLLKNSGLVGEDVKVFYITDSNREFPIESQTDFQIALYAFRRKARMGDLVNIRLETLSELPQIKKAPRYSNDVETQSDNNEATSLVSTCCNSENPPEWFVMYMNQFKKEIMDDVTATVSNIVSNMKSSMPIQSTCYHARKSKADSSKRMRKLQPLIADSSHDAKDLLKSLKLEGKLERKLEKLEHKSKKVREKKLSLLTKSSDSEAGQGSTRTLSQRYEREEEWWQMDATPINVDGSVPHFLGGEVYLHRWSVKNTGKLPWTSKTTLTFTWGSKALKALDKVLSVPYLKPGDIGYISVRLQIPNQPGDYECYFHFNHKERRFGHWLGCRVIVDSFDLKGNNSVLETGNLDQFSPIKVISSTTLAPEVVDDIEHPVTHYGGIKKQPSRSNSPTNSLYPTQQQFEDLVEDIISEKKMICKRFEDLKLQDPTDTNCSSDSDNQSIISLGESVGSKAHEDFVVVDDMVLPSTSREPPKKEDQDEGIVVDAVAQAQAEEPQVNYDDNNNTGETDQNIAEAAKDETASNCSQDSDIIIVTLSNEEDQNDKYAYIIVDGQKLPVPKKLIKSEYLESAEKLSKTETLSRASSSNSSVEIISKSEMPSPPERRSESPVHVIKPELEFPRKIDLLAAALNAVAPRSTPETVAAPPPPPGLKTEVTGVGPESLQEFSIPPTFGDHFPAVPPEDFTSHCSATGSCFSDVNSSSERNSRLFIFPQDYPGYEVIQPNGEVVTLPLVTPEQYAWATSGTQYSFAPPQPVVTREPLNLSTHDQNPFTTTPNAHIPNYQQTPPEQRSSPVYFDATANFETVTTTNASTNQTSTPQANATAPSAPPDRSRENVVHILPETLVSGAVNVASSAINTARSVINMIRPQEINSQSATTANTDVSDQHSNTNFQQAGRWVNGHWITTNPDSSREANLHALAEMGFWDRDLNATLLARYNDDLSRVVAELVQ